MAVLLHCLALGVLFFHGAHSQCAKPCALVRKNTWQDGYHANLMVTAPGWYTGQKYVNITLQFDIKPQKLENLHILGGSIDAAKSRLERKTAVVIFKPDQTIRKGSSVKIEFIVRHGTGEPKLLQVKFWKEVACSALCPPNTTTAKPMTTQPSEFRSCAAFFKEVQNASGFMKLIITLPVNEAMKGWQLAIQFTKPVRISQAVATVIEERSMKYFLLKSHVYNQDKDVGNFTFDLIVHFVASDIYVPKIAMIKFGSFTCKLNDAVTIPPTTQPTQKPVVTTMAPEVTTMAPEVTTIAPEATTKAPEVTTKAPEVTTMAPEVTTIAPEVTTMAPEVTTVAPEVTTMAPEVTTKAPDVTTMAPEVTTKSKTDAPTTQSPLSCSPKYDYAKVINMSLLFYEAQRSGALPPTNRIPYRKDSALGDGGDVGLDLTGGYYDAGDFVKFGFPMAYTVTVLAWGAIQYEKGYKASGQHQNVLDAIRWGTDYFIKCHSANANELYGQVGDGDADHVYWGRPEDMTMKRPSAKIDTSKPGSDLAGETAAALAAASIVFKSNAAYSATLISHAKQLYDFADKFRGSYSDSIPNVGKFYKSWSGYKDELTWAAAWLYRATMEAKYLTAAERFYSQFGMNSNPQEFSWDDKKAGVQVLMSQITGKSSYKSNIQTFCDSILAKDTTPNRIVYISQWGTNRHAANVAFICLQAADLGIKQAAYQAFARKQVHCMLGDSGRSFVVGFGNNPPKRPHHRSSSCPNAPDVCDWNNYNSAQPNPHVLYGALVGGPDQNGVYEDRRNDYIKNEVACDYNAGFQSVVAGLRDLQSQGEC